MNEVRKNNYLKSKVGKKLPYHVPDSFLSIYSPKDIHELKKCFKPFDTNGDGTMDKSNVVSALKEFDPNLKVSNVKMISKFRELNMNTSYIEFHDFLNLLDGMCQVGGRKKSSSNASLNERRQSLNDANVASNTTGSVPAKFEASGASLRGDTEKSTTEGTPEYAGAMKDVGGKNTGRRESRSGSVTGGVRNIQLHEVAGSSGGKHSYSQDEKEAFTEHINNCLQGDKDLSMLPMDCMSDALFASVQDGILLCKLINLAVPDTIDMRAVNTKGKKLNVYQKTENHNLSINAAKSIGCKVVNIGPQDLLNGKPILVLGLVWQIVKIQLTCTINLKSHPELVRLLLPDESLEEFMNLPPDQILLRWMNYHLKEANYEGEVTNFGNDVKDAKAYSVLLHQIAPKICPLVNAVQSDKRAFKVIENAQRLEVETFIKPTDITSGNTKLNMSFVAQLFNTCPALEVVEEKELKILADVLDDSDIGDTREERVFRLWINSLGLDNVYINHLFTDLKDGLVLLKLLDNIEKGIVSWVKVNKVPKNKFKKVENCNYCVVLGKQLKFSLVNVGGVDISSGNKKLILALIWQMMRYHQLKMLSQLGQHGGKSTVNDQDVLDWANKKVDSVPNINRTSACRGQIIQFRDSSLNNGLFFLDLLYAVEPRAVDYDQITDGKSTADKESNAKYVLSVARKIGAAVFLTYEDILEVKPKMMMTFVATIMYLDMQNSNESE